MTSQASANAGLPMVALVLPPAWFALVPIIAIETAYGVWRFRTSARSTWLGVTVANCVSTLIGLPVTWAVLVLAEGIVFTRFSDRLSEPPEALLAILTAPWLGPGAGEPRWFVPLAIVALMIPFYVMSVISESLIVRRFVPDLPGRTVWSWMLQANAASYALLLLITLAG